MLTALFFATGLLAAEQVPAAPPAVVISQADVAAATKQTTEALLFDRIIDGGGHNVGVAVIRRVKPESSALQHEKISEVYHVVSGSGTLVSGGTIVNGKALPASTTIGPSISGEVQGGERRRIGPGDIVMIPARVPHMLVEVDDIIYLAVRSDPARVLGLK